MARIRTIKPEFWTDEIITECSLSARLLFIAIWNFADDRGNIERSAKQIKCKVFPADNIETEPIIIELIAKGLLIEYKVKEAIYLHIKGFLKHQIINRPSKTGLPEFDESLIVHTPLTECSLTEGKGREGKGREGIKVKRVVSKRFSPPTAEEVHSYMQEIKYNGDAQQWVDFYTAKGWMVGKNKMADWKAAVRTWRNKDKTPPPMENPFEARRRQLNESATS
jgi:hypothetical protein